MKNNKGFISTTLIYTFFIIFLLLMVFTLGTYSKVRYLLEEYRYDIKNSFVSESKSDIELKFYVKECSDPSCDYELKSEMPTTNLYVFDRYDCSRGSLEYINNNISITTNGKTECIAYFSRAQSDIVLEIYTKENSNDKPIYVNDIPNNLYVYQDSETKCYDTEENEIAKENYDLDYDDVNKKFTITYGDKIKCKAYFIRKESDITVNIYEETYDGKHKQEIEGVTFKFSLVSEKPTDNYKLDEDSSYCKINGNTTKHKISITNGEFTVPGDLKGKKITCNLYYLNIMSGPKLIYLIEQENPSDNYYTYNGKTYIEATGIEATGKLPVGYNLVHYECSPYPATITKNNGSYVGEGSKFTTCKLYFDKSTHNNIINYYLLDTSGKNPELVTKIPEIGYIYDHGSCINGSTIIPYANYVVIEGTGSDECDVYFKKINPDITVIVYVRNHKNGKYEIQDSIPLLGYEFNPGLSYCDNGAKITYSDSKIIVNSSSQTTCYVFFGEIK